MTIKILVHVEIRPTEQEVRLLGHARYDTPARGPRGEGPPLRIRATPRRRLDEPAGTRRRADQTVEPSGVG